MGLLDFISKSSPNAQSDNSNQQTNNQQGVPQNAQFSDIQYPIPSATTQTGDYSQYTYDPSQVSAQDFNATTPQPSVTSTQPPSGGDDGIVADITQQNIPNYNFDPSGSVLNNQGTVEDLTQYNPVGIPDQSQSQIIDLTAPQSNPTGNPQPEPQEVAQQPQMTVADDSNYDLTRNPEQTQLPADQTPPVTGLPQQPVLQEQAAVQPTVETPKIEGLEPIISENINQNQTSSQVETIERPVKAVLSPDPSDPSTSAVSADLPPVGELVTGNEVKIEDVNNKPKETAEKKAEETITETNPESSVEQVGIIDSSEKSEVETTDVKPEQVIETASEEAEKDKAVETEQTPKAALEKEIRELSSDYEFKKIKNVAFLGLNSKTFNNVSSEVNALGKFLSQKGVNVLIDSNKGYGHELVSVLESLEKSKVTAVHFKPFYTNYSDEADRHTKIHDYTTVVYSDFVERLKYFIRESEAFVLPETTGLMNLSTLTLLLSLQYLYIGQHKPVILLGNKWSSKVNQLKTISGLGDEEYSSIIVASKAEDAIKILTETDEKLVSENKSKSRRFYDYREDFDEYEYMN